MLNDRIAMRYVDLLDAAQELIGRLVAKAIEREVEQLEGAEHPEE